MKLPTLKCRRCGHTWTRRQSKLPKKCPRQNCKSRYWNRKRINRSYG